MLGYLEKGIQNPVAQGRSTKVISMIEWIRTSRLSMKNYLSLPREQAGIRPLAPRGGSHRGLELFQRAIFKNSNDDVSTETGTLSLNCFLPAPRIWSAAKFDRKCSMPLF